MAYGAGVLSTGMTAQSWAVAVTAGSGQQIEVTVPDVGLAQRTLPAVAAAQGVGLLRGETGELGLEEAFVEFVGEAKESRSRPQGGPWNRADVADLCGARAAVVFLS